MRKILFFIVTVLFSLTTKANGITLKYGDASILEKSDIVASVSFDYSNTLIEDKPAMTYLKEHGDDFVKDWPKDNQALQTIFVKRWNKKNKKGFQVTENDNAVYRMIITVSKLDMGSFGASFAIGMGAGGAKMSGKVELYKKGVREPVLILDVDGQTGKSEWTEQQRRTSLYNELADDAIECLKDAKKK